MAQLIEDLGQRYDRVVVDTPAALGLPDFGPEFSVSCENHGGEGFVAVTQWDAEAKEWNLVSDFMQSDQDVIQPLIDADSSAYAEENAIEGNC